MASWKRKVERGVAHHHLDRAFWLFFVIGIALVIAGFFGFFYPDLIAAMIIIAIGFYKLGEIIHVKEEREARLRLRSSMHRISDTVDDMNASVKRTGEELAEHTRESFYRLQSIDKKLEKDLASQDRKIKLARGFTKSRTNKLQKELDLVVEEFEAAKGDIQDAKLGYLELRKKVKVADGLMEEIKTEFGEKQGKIERKVEQNFRDLARKIIEIENRFNKVKKALE